MLLIIYYTFVANSNYTFALSQLHYLNLCVYLLFRNPSVERLTTVASLAVIITAASLCALLVLFIEVITFLSQFNPYNQTYN